MVSTNDNTSCSHTTPLCLESPTQQGSCSQVASLYPGDPDGAFFHAWGVLAVQAPSPVAGASRAEHMRLVGSQMIF